MSDWKSHRSQRNLHDTNAYLETKSWEQEADFEVDKEKEEGGEKEEEEEVEGDGEEEEGGEDEVAVAATGKRAAEDDVDVDVDTQKENTGEDGQTVKEENQLKIHDLFTPHLPSQNLNVVLSE